jgi:serine/threonine protein kinase
MAEVFKAKSFGVEGFEKVVVIKRILPELAENPLFVDMFIYEAKLAVRLSHANIVQVFDLGIAKAAAGPGSYVLAMELVHGSSARCRSRCACTSPPRSPRASTTRTAGGTSRTSRSASCTATSRRRTCCSASRAR